jgi:hypothetical protein
MVLQLGLNPAAWVHTALGRPPGNWASAYAIHVASSDPISDVGGDKRRDRAPIRWTEVQLSGIGSCMQE